MQRHKIVGKASVGVLLFLPLVAVGVALMLMLSWGHQGTQQVAADQNTGVDLNISDDTGGANIDVDTTKGPSKVIGFEVTLEIAAFADPGLVDAAGQPGYDGVQMVIFWNPAVLQGPALNQDGTFDEKALAVVNDITCGGTPVVTPVKAGDKLTVACNRNFGQPLQTATGTLATVPFNCIQAGSTAVVLAHGPPTPANLSHFTDTSFSPHWEDIAGKNEVAEITCVPPAGEININKVAKDNGSLLGGSCWLISVSVPTGMSPPNDFLNKPVDVVSDNNAEPACDNTPGAPFKADLSDRNPDDGLIDINISGKLRVEFGDVYHFQEVKAPDKYAINDSTKYTCTFTDTPKTLDPGEQGPKVGCDEDGGTSTTVLNARVAGNINITFNDPFGGAQTGICVDINPGALNVCDGDDGSSDGSISQTLATDVYSVAIDPASVPSTVVAKEPTTVEADLNANKKVNVKFSFNTSLPVFEKKKSLANLFLTAQGPNLDPANCEASTDVAEFRLNLNSPPSSQNVKGDPQDVRAFEYEIRFDGGQVCVSWTPGKFVTNNNMSCTKTTSEEKGLILVGCVTQKTTPQVPIDNSNLELGVIEVRPQPSLYSIIFAKQDNGVVVQIRNDQCNLVDLQGHPIDALPEGVGTECPDSDLTIRWLEGDVDGNCIVNATDQQLLAFRWGISKGVQLYNDRFNLVGELETINIKDVQFVFGRHNSKCDQFNSKGFSGPPNPPQPPVKKKIANP